MIELQKLIQPISPENPAGESLRYSTVYDSIKAARRKTMPNLPQGIWQTKLKKADWEGSSKHLPRCASKPLERPSGCRMAAASMRPSGRFRRTGGWISRPYGALREFLETLYPPIDAEDPEYRYGPVVWIDEKLTQTLKLVPITKPKAVEDASIPGGIGKPLIKPRLRRGKNPQARSLHPTPPGRFKAN